MYHTLRGLSQVQSKSVPRLDSSCLLAGSVCPGSCTDYGKSIKGSGQSLLQSSLSLHMGRYAESFWLWVFWAVLWHLISVPWGTWGLRGRKNTLLQHQALGIEFLVEFCSCQGALRFIITLILFLTCFLCFLVSRASLPSPPGCSHPDLLFL